MLKNLFYKKLPIAYIFDKRVSVSLVLVLVSLFLASLYRRIMHVDDAWLAEYAYWLYKTGHVKSELFRGFEQYENQIFVCHKLFLIQGAALIKHFGFNLYVLKSVSLFYSVWVFIFVYAYLKKVVEKRELMAYFLVFLAIFLPNPCFFLYAFVFRPEVNVVAFGLVSFYFLNEGLNNSKLMHIIFSAFFAGMAVLTHLNGVIFLSAGLLVLLTEKHFKYTVVFGLVGAFTSAFYFYDISPNDVDIFLKQLKNDPALENSNFNWYSYAVNILKEHERFFHSPKEIIFSVLLIFVVWFNFDFLKARHKRLLLFTCFLVLSLAIIAHGKTSKYILIYLPFLCLLIVFGLGNMKQNGFKNSLFTFLLAFYFVGSSIQNSILIRWNTPNLSDQTRLVMKSIPKGTKVLTPIGFIFNEISNYQIQGLHVYRFFEDRGLYFEKKFDPFLISAHFQNAYIVMDAEYLAHYNLRPDKNYGRYRLISNGKFMIFKRRDL